METYTRRISAWIGLGALLVAFGHSDVARADWPPTISKRQASSFTQAVAILECTRILTLTKSNHKIECKLLPDSWVTERCIVKNPRLPYRFYLGSWGACPFRYWTKLRDGSQQQLHGCYFVLRRSPPRFNLKGSCKAGTRFPT